MSGACSASTGHVAAIVSSSWVVRRADDREAEHGIHGIVHLLGAGINDGAIGGPDDTACAQAGANGRHGVALTQPGFEAGFNIGRKAASRRQAQQKQGPLDRLAFDLFGVAALLASVASGGASKMSLNVAASATATRLAGSLMTTSGS